VDFAVCSDNGMVEVLRNDMDLEAANMIRILEQAWPRSCSEIRWGLWGSAQWDDTGRMVFAVTSTTGHTQVFQYDGDSDFDQVWSNEAADSGALGIGWGDWNNDGYLDLAITNDSSQDRVFENRADDGERTLALAWTSDSDEVSLDATWLDLNSDGFFDLFVVVDGDDYWALNVAGEGDTRDLEEAGTNDVDSFFLAPADYDLDGDLDLVMTGGTENSWIYRNEGGTLETATMIGRSYVASHHVAWGDCGFE